MISEENVSKRNRNHEWNTATTLRQPYSRKNWRNFRLLPVICCFAGWKYHHWDNCLQDENHEKTHQLFHRKHGHVRFPVPEFPACSRE